MKTTVGRVYRFRAVHSLPDFPEPWCFPHEHDYTVEVEVAGGTDTDYVDRAWASFRLVDGCDVNAKFHPSTVENIAECLLTDLEPRKALSVISVTVWEDKQRWGRAER